MALSATIEAMTMKMQIAMALFATGLLVGCARKPYPPEKCTYFLTGEVDLPGKKGLTDTDGDGVSNGWDQCPNNPEDWLDSDRDGIGNRFDNDIDGDNIANEEDEDMDGDGALNVDEEADGSDPRDPTSIPDLPRLEFDAGILSEEARWYRGDFHVHTEYSHDSQEPLTSWFDATFNARLDFTAITDHRNVDVFFDESWSQASDVLLIPGIEWGGPGHANMFGLRTDNTTNYDSAADVFAAWRKNYLQGGAQSLNHYGNDDDATYWERILDEEPKLLQFLDVMEVWNVAWPAGASQNLVSIARWEQLLLDGHMIGALGGSDVHYSFLPIGYPTTFVYAQSLSVPGILHGLREGRTYVANAFPYTPGPNGANFNHPNTPTLEFTITSDDNRQPEAIIGDFISAGPVTIRISVTDAQGPIQLYRGLDVIASFTDHRVGDTVFYTFDDDATAPSWYRVEMWTGGGIDADLVLFSSPIYIR